MSLLACSYIVLRLGLDVTYYLLQSYGAWRIAIGLSGCAPRLGSSRGHSALIPDGSGPVGLRASLAP